MSKSLAHGRAALLRASAAFVPACLLAIAAPAGATTVDIPFNAANFSNAPLVINNSYWPLVAGTTQTYKADTKDGCEIDIFEITNSTKTILTVDTRVVHDTAYEAEDCDAPMAEWAKVEETDDWYAQDNAGNIWYFGEDTNDCDEGGCTPGEGSWEAGVDGAEAGIIMLASPAAGLRYRQEYYEGSAQDWGMVMRTNDTVILQRDDAVAPGEWSDCLVTKEWNELEPGGIEQKYYCPNVGLVAVDEHSGAKLHAELVENGAAAAATDFGIRLPPK